MQIVSHLLTWGSQFVNVNSTNLEGKTAWDILQGQTQVNSREIGLMLHSAGVSSGVSLFSNTRSDDKNIDEFYNLIGEDVKLLEYIDELPFVNTPLHSYILWEHPICPRDDEFKALICKETKSKWV